MATVSTPAATIVARTATLGDLHRVLADLAAAHPEAGHRVQHGAFLAIMGHAEPSGPGAWWVTSERAAQAQYFVLPQYGTCTCQDHQRHGSASPCKHLLCVETLARLERVEADRGTPAECCIDCEDGGRESPEGMRRRCSNCPLTETWTAEERAAGYQPDADAPIPFALSDAAYAVLAALGEPCEMVAAPPVGTCTRRGPTSATGRALYAELGGDPDAA